MREIKFRGKRIDNGEWVYGWLIKTKNHNKAYYISDGNLYNGFGVMQPFLEVIPETVGEFTGQRDENGKEVYENDRIQTWDGRIGSVKFGRVLDSSAIAYSGFYIRYNEQEYDNLDGALKIIND